MKKTNWIKIGPLPGIVYGEMIAEVLKKRGIPHTLYQDGMSTAYNISGTNLAGNEAYFLVPPEFEEEVRGIIEQMIDHI